jgi:galactokinase
MLKMSYNKNSLAQLNSEKKQTAQRLVDHSREMKRQAQLSAAENPDDKASKKWAAKMKKEHKKIKSDNEAILHPIKHKAKIVAKVALGGAIAGGAAYGGYKLYQKYGKKK